jgi:hypothetical protein
VDTADQSTQAQKATRRGRRPDFQADGARSWPALKALDFEGEDWSLTQAHLALLK